MSKASAVPESSIPEWPYVMYLLSGPGGLVFWVGEEASRLGWLEKAITFIFGDFADSVQSYLQLIEILLTFLLVIVIPLMVILAMIIVVRFWRWWHLASPAAILLFTISIFIGNELLTHYQSEVFTMSVTILFGLYFLSASFIGLRWLFKNKLKQSKHTYF